MVGKLVGLVAVRCRPLLVRFASLLVCGFHLHVDGVDGVCVGKEPCLHLRFEVVLIAVAVFYGERVLLVREESLGRLSARVPSVAVSHVGAYVEAVARVLLRALRLPVVLVVVRAILALAVAVDVAVHGRANRLVNVAVGVVGLGIHHLRVVVAQPACGESCAVAFLGLVLGVDVAIPLVEESRLHLYVEHMILLALVLARVSRQFRLAVVHLQLVSHICRQLSQNLVAAEHVLAVHHQADGFVVPEQLAVASLHARQFLDEFVEACAFLQLEGLGVEHYGVATHSDARHLRRHFHLLKHERRGL